MPKPSPERTCRECGKPLTDQPRTAVFCCSPCRKAYNNRRMIRGAELYDLYMAIRYERDMASRNNLMTVISNLARAYRDSDVANRDGRPSWNAKETLRRLPLAYGKAGDQR